MSDFAKSKSGARLLSRGPSRKVLLGMDRRLGKSFVISLKTITRSIPLASLRKREEDEEGEEPLESKTCVIATLIARINHNRGKWRRELLKQGYVLSVALLRLARSRPSPLFAFLGLCQCSHSFLFLPLFSLSISRFSSLALFPTNHPSYATSCTTFQPNLAKQWHRAGSVTWFIMAYYIPHRVMHIGHWNKRIWTRSREKRKV